MVEDHLSDTSTEIAHRDEVLAAAALEFARLVPSVRRMPASTSRTAGWRMSICSPATRCACAMAIRRRVMVETL